MSQRHRRVEAIPPVKQELRAHAHNERHRVHSALHSMTEQVQHGVEPEDIDEPGANWKPLHHHDPKSRCKRAGVSVSGIGKLSHGSAVRLCVESAHC